MWPAKPCRFPTTPTDPRDPMSTWQGLLDRTVKPRLERRLERRFVICIFAAVVLSASFSRCFTELIQPTKPAKHYSLSFARMYSADSMS